jgi:hypothetical protein
MADKAIVDKAISDLTQALQITNEDLFVLEQSGEAKKLKGSQVVQYAKDSVAAEVQGVKEYADSAKASADAAAASAEKAAGAAQGIDDKVAAADTSAKAAASSAAAAAASATGVDEKVQAAQTAATNAAKSETAAKDAQTAAANAQKVAESAQTGAQTAKTAAESAQKAAESAKDAAAGSSTAAGQKATQAAQSAEDAASAKSAAETAKTDAQAARDAIVNMIVEAVTLETGKPATVSKSLVDNVYKLVFGLPRGGTGAQGPQGATGNGISGIALKSGTHAPGTSDVYTITLTDGTTFDFAVYNGANGQGAGDMLASVYDPQGKHQDVFKYVDDAIGVIPTPDVSAQIKAHNESKTAHPYIRGLIPTKTSQLKNDSGYLTQHQDISGKLDKTGDGSNVTAAFTAASTRVNIATGEKLSVLFGKIAKWFGDLGSLAFKSTVAKSDLASDVQTSLGKADSALQSAPVTSVNGATGEVKGTFYVTVTQGDNNSVTADKTAAEVYEAYAAGYAVYAITKFPETDVPFVLPLVSAVNMRDMILLGFAALGSLSSIAAPNYPVVAYNGASRKWAAWIGTLARASDIPTIPTALKNPNALNIKIGDTTTSYDGSAAKTVKIPEGGPTMRKVTLPVTGWNSSTKQQSVTVTGVLADGTKQRVICSPVDESYDSAWNSCYVQCVGHGADSLTFQCDEIPTAAIEVYVSIQPVSFAS